MSERIDRSRMEEVVNNDLQPDIQGDVLNLRAMRFAELLDTIFSLYRKRFWAFLGISSGYCITLLTVISTFFLNNSVGNGMVVIWILIIGVFWSASIFVVSGLMLASAEAYLGRHIRVGSVLRQSRDRFLRCLVGSLLFGLLAVLLIFLSVVLFVGISDTFSENLDNFIGPLFIVLIPILVTGCFVTYWFFFAAAVLVEGSSMLEGLKRRGELIRGNWWRIVGTVLAIFLLSFVIGFILRATFALPLTFTGLRGIGDFSQNIGWMVLWELPTRSAELYPSHALMYLINLGIDTFTLPIWVIGCTLLYFNQRIRKEGFDIEVMVARQREGRDGRKN